MSIDAGNAKAVKRMMEARPMLTGVDEARRVIPGMKDNLLLHAGPPIDWPRMSGPLRPGRGCGVLFGGFGGTHKNRGGAA